MTTHAIEVLVSIPGYEALGALTVYLRIPLALGDVELVWRAGMAPWLALEAAAVTDADTVARPIPIVVIGGAAGPIRVVHTPAVIIPPLDPVSAPPGEALLLATVPPRRLPPRVPTARSAEELHALAVAGKAKRWPTN